MASTRRPKVHSPIKTMACIAIWASACYPLSSSGPNVQTVVSPSAPLAAYRTFSFGFTEDPPASYETSARSLEVERRVRELLDGAFRAKGYVQDDTDPNFVVRFAAGIQQGQDASYFEDATSLTSFGLPLGEINVRIFDASSKTEVWRGSAVSHIDLSKDIDNGLLKRAVQGVLASFPNRSVRADPPAASAVPVTASMNPI